MNKYYWLNKDSKAFLRRGYLQTGETAEQRILDIAKSAEKYLKVKFKMKKYIILLSVLFFMFTSCRDSDIGFITAQPNSLEEIEVIPKISALHAVTLSYLPPKPVSIMA